MSSEMSVVTPERFAIGLSSFTEWMSAIESREQEFQRHYDEYDPDPDELRVITLLVESHGVKALVLGEDWCPDVWRGLPVIAKVAELTGMELRLFFRDQNKDIMSEFLKDGEFESIPVIVFYDRGHQYLGHWIERPVLANEEMEPLREIMTGKERGTPEWDEARAKYLTSTWTHAVGWRNAELSEIRELLESSLSS
jgi:hypothetical protein